MGNDFVWVFENKKINFKKEYTNMIFTKDMDAWLNKEIYKHKEYIDILTSQSEWIYKYNPNKNFIKKVVNNEKIIDYIIDKSLFYCLVVYDEVDELYQKK